MKRRRVMTSVQSVLSSQFVSSQLSEPAERGLGFLFFLEQEIPIIKQEERMTARLVYRELRTVNSYPNISFTLPSSERIIG